MTSKRECFAYITLPDQVSPITAGKLVLETTQSGENIGRFVYAKSYLSRSDAVEFDPVELKLTDRVYETVLSKGVFGALRDALPDHWGRRLIEKRLNKPILSELDYLLNLADDQAGALGFGLSKTPLTPEQKFNRVIDLERLQRIAGEIMREANSTDSARLQIEELMLVKTSMGGARPKVVVSDGDALWLAKFNCDSDRWNYAVAEHATLTLARECGINAAQSKIEKVGDREVLLVKRFDREHTDKGYLRRRMISAMTALRIDDDCIDRNKWSYIALVEELRKFSSFAKEDAKELFRRMAFNALISNADDHPRNHAFIADGKWRLSPAYDLTPNPSISIERRDLAMVCGVQGRFANRSNLLSECRRFLLEPSEAVEIIDKTTERVKNDWRKIARKAGLCERDCDVIKPAFAYDG
ncbi:MAG: type II toxin-antitoxin system HipA family toxin, partial [Helicobacteraceae bacterium]|nr:type II toxin-antitoxin system HipA family toxin [Helicobacteraceae bacterium]